MRVKKLVREFYAELAFVAWLTTMFVMTVLR